MVDFYDYDGHKLNSDDHEQNVYDENRNLIGTLDQGQFYDTNGNKM